MFFTMHKKFRQIFSALKEHSSLSYAKVATVTGFCDIELLIIKVTSPDDLPLQEKYIHELVNIFSVSPTSYKSFAVNFAVRFNKTRSWRVALRCLLLLHRLLRLFPEVSPFRNELLWVRSSRFLSFYPCYFQDDSSSTPESYTEFIRSYARLLDEVLNVCSDYEDEKPSDMVSKKLEFLPQVQSLMDRIMECRPVGLAEKSLTVQSAMKHIIRDSFTFYTTLRREIVELLDHLFQMEYKNCISTFQIYKRAAIQANQLCKFYDWCMSKWLCGPYEYPFVDKIPMIHVFALETFINGMWLFMESSSSSSSSTSSSIKWENFEDEMEKPLILFRERESDDSWESLLEDSIVNLPQFHQNDLICFDDCDDKETIQSGMQVYYPNILNPFSMKAIDEQPRIGQDLSPPVSEYIVLIQQ